jgi:HAD superfamily hydrolase (TIGR01509 family)
MQKSTIFWDNDGVLVDTETLYYRATRQILKGQGVALGADQFRELFLKQSTGAFHLAVANGTPPAAVAGLRDERNRLYAQLLKTEPLAVDGAAGALCALHGRVSMGVVTSSRRDHFEMIHARTGFARYFEFVVTGEDVAATKPDPEPYLRALALTRQRPEACLAIEDSERGLAAAKAAGLECWVIPTALTRGGDFSAADRVLRSLVEIPALLNVG